MSLIDDMFGAILSSRHRDIFSVLIQLVGKIVNSRNYDAFYSDGAVFAVIVLTYQLGFQNTAETVAILIEKSTDGEPNKH